MFSIINKCVLLDNNNVYKIMYSIDLNDRRVFYLINIKDIADIKFCYMIDDDTFEEIRSKDELVEVVNKMTEGATLFFK